MAPPFGSRLQRLTAPLALRLASFHPVRSASPLPRLAISTYSPPACGVAASASTSVTTGRAAAEPVTAIIQGPGAAAFPARSSARSRTFTRRPGQRPDAVAAPGQRVGAPHGSCPGQGANSPQATRLPGKSGSDPQPSPTRSTATSIPRRVTSDASAPRVSAVSAGRTRTEAGATSGARSSRQEAARMEGSGSGRFPPASRTPSSRGAKGPEGSGPSRARARTSGEMDLARPGMFFTTSEPVTGSEKPIRISWRFDGAGPWGGTIHRAVGGSRSGIGPVRKVVAKARFRPVGSMTARPLTLRMPVPTTTA
jgi:hypothetical protein